ncbi:hypothetical protein F2Q68_00038954 [Brassica cretica]|uniref:Uncharacterized protein n=2 Tax=Brassica cretica TaxID=69181 RepID=A0A3N6RLG2_BRACR|nr:hypothetical protein F2Q68_00038954 [Brassica cretica]KAF3495566.1 hypothetical protein DY000_02052522 [Brassica cretica]
MSVYNKVGASATRAVGEFPSSNNLRLQNQVESQLEIRKTESCQIALNANFNGNFDRNDVRNDMAAFGRYLATWSALDRSLHSNRTKGLVGRNVETDSFAGRSLRSDRPSGLDGRFGRYVPTDRVAYSVATRSRVGRYVATDRMAWVFDTMPRDVRNQCAALRAIPRSNQGFRGAMTTSTYVSRIVFDLILSRFKVRDMFSAYVTCMVGIEHLFEDNFKSPESADQNFGFFYIALLPLCRVYERYLYEMAKSV